MKCDLLPALVFAFAVQATSAQTVTQPDPQTAAQMAQLNAAAGRPPAAGPLIQAPELKVIPGTVTVPANPAGTRFIFPFDAHWRFNRVLPPLADGSQPAGWNAWQFVDLPHDWSIAGPYEHDAAAARGGAYLPTGQGEYLKTFLLPAEDAGRHVEIQFDGIMANGEVLVNGHSLGARPNGYVGVNYDLTPYVTFGPDKMNGLQVKVDNSIQHASRYYTGSGIERHTRLVVTDPVHVMDWGVYVVTKNINPLTLDGGLGGIRTATLEVQTAVVNGSDAPRTVGVQTSIIGPDGKPAKFFASQGRPYQPPAAQTIAPGQVASFVEEIVVTSPEVWDLEHPNLYQAVAQVVANGKPLDNQAATFGIRVIEFKPETGFWLNGKNLKLLGVCLHEDAGALGEAVPRSLFEARVAAVKAMGANAIRLAHNSPDPVMLDVCDRMGLLVMDELFDCWTVGKPNAERGYNLFFSEWSLPDLRDTVLRDRNHPSIILWSAGNEIHDTPQEQKAIGILTGLVNEFHKYDPSRPVTQALFRPNTSHDYTNGLADLLDVIGTNYRDTELLAAQRAVPSRKLLNTEERQDRGTWLTVRDNPPLSGTFLWAGIDYLGEGLVNDRPAGVDDPSEAWPNTTSRGGLFDRTIRPKPTALERESWWSTKPVVHIVRSTDRVIPRLPSGATVPPPVYNMLPDWTPTPGNNYARADIDVLSNCEEVELFLNGRSLGKKTLPADASARRWSGAYEPGTVRAVGYNQGIEVAHEDLTTAGAPAKITLTANRATASPSFDDVLIVRATVTDDKGVRVPYAANAITFKATGPGTVIATDNGDYADHVVFSEPTRPARDGTCVAYVRANAPAGQITITASTGGLTPGTLKLDAVPVTTAK